MIVTFLLPEMVADVVEKNVGFIGGKGFPAVQNVTERVLRVWPDDGMNMIRHHNPSVQIVALTREKIQRTRRKIGNLRHLEPAITSAGIKECFDPVRIPDEELLFFLPGERTIFRPCLLSDSLALVFEFFKCLARQGIHEPKGNEIAGAFAFQMRKPTAKVKTRNQMRGGLWFSRGCHGETSSKLPLWRQPSWLPVNAASEPRVPAGDPNLRLGSRSYRHAGSVPLHARFEGLRSGLRGVHYLLRLVVMDTTINGTPRKRHVLIVDDDISLAWPFKELLERHGYEATIVPDGALALKYVSEHRLDAVVCDLQGFHLDGDLLYATIERSNPSLARHFVFIAGSGDGSAFEKFASEAALPVLHKPVAMDALVSEVVRVTERQ